MLRKPMVSTEVVSLKHQPSINQTVLDVCITTPQMPCNVKTIKSAPLGKITIHRTDAYQEVFGFGGAVTDSAAMNIHNLTHETSEYLLGYNKLQIV